MTLVNKIVLFGIIPIIGGRLLGEFVEIYTNVKGMSWCGFAIGVIVSILLFINFDFKDKSSDLNSKEKKDE